MLPKVIVLNGASSSGKTTLARALQAELPGHWLLFGVDDLIRALPPRLLTGDGIEFGPNGEVEVGPAFRTLERAWMQGVVATAAAGAHVIVDDVFLSGRAAQQRWEKVLGELPTCWIGILCDPDIAAAREQARGDRTVGMHREQAQKVHVGVQYDLEIDTSQESPEALARQLATALAAREHED